jgi:hypothetical protein
MRNDGRQGEICVRNYNRQNIQGKNFDMENPIVV